MRKAQNPMRRSWLDDEGGGFIPHRLRLVMSPAWRHRPVPLCRILERIEIEHLRHGGQQNGHLCVSYDQFVKHGVSRRAIRGAIALGQTLGLLEVIQSDDWANHVRMPNEYRLTYIPEKDRRAPTDEWATVTDKDAREAVRAYRSSLSQKPDAQYPNLQPTSAHSCTENPSTSAHSCTSPVPKRELSLISGRKAGGAGPLAEPSGDGLAALKLAGEGSR